MKKTTSVFAILFVAMGFLTMSFTRNPSALLGASNRITADAETSREIEDVSIITSIIHITPVLTNTQTVKCAITLYVSQEIAQWSQDGSVEQLSHKINDEKTPVRLMNSL